MNNGEAIEIADEVVTKLQRVVNIPSGEGIRMFCVGRIRDEFLRQQAIMLELIEDRICQDRTVCGCCCNVWESMDEIRGISSKNKKEDSQ